MSKYVFIDLDGTLVHGGGDTIPTSAKIALEKARENGHKLIACTGRSQATARVIDFEMDGYITGAGSYISLFNKTLMDQPIPRDLVHQINEKAKELNIDVTYECIEKCYCPDLMYNYLHAPERENRYSHYWVPVKEYDGEDAYKLLIETHNKEAFEDLKTLLKDDCHLYDISKDGLYRSEVISNKVSKDFAIQYIVNEGHVALEDTIGIGDSFNDLEMLKKCGQSVAMGNAFEEIKPYATFVTTDIDHDGIYNAFEKLELI